MGQVAVDANGRMLEVVDGQWVPTDLDRSKEIVLQLGKQSDLNKRPVALPGPSNPLKLDSPEDLQATSARVDAEQKRQASEFARLRQQSATQEPTFRKFAGATIPTLAGLAGFIPGLQGIPAQMALGAAGTGLNQLAGFEKPDATEIAKSAGIPLAISGTLKTGKALLKGGAELLAPGALKEAGVEALAERVGSKASSADRIITGSSLAKSLFGAALHAPNVPTRDLAEAADLVYQTEKGMASPNQVLLKTSQNLRNKFESMASTGYEDVMNEAQRLRLTAKQFEEKQPQVSKALNELREELLTKMESVSPVIRQANAEYRKYIATQDMIDAVRSGNPGTRIRKLFERSPTMISALGLKNKKDINEVFSLADAISDVASSAPAGLGRQLLSSLTEPIGQLLTTQSGRYFMRQLIKPGSKVTTPVLVALGQFGRAYAAQGTSE